jgi:hypothetical protein
VAGSRGTFAHFSPVEPTPIIHLRTSLVDGA